MLIEQILNQRKITPFVSIQKFIRRQLISTGLTCKITRFIFWSPNLEGISFEIKNGLFSGFVLFYRVTTSDQGTTKSSIYYQGMAVTL